MPRVTHLKKNNRIEMMEFQASSKPACFIQWKNLLPVLANREKIIGWGIIYAGLRSRTNVKEDMRAYHKRVKSFCAPHL